MEWATVRLGTLSRPKWCEKSLIWSCTQRLFDDSYSVDQNECRHKINFSLFKHRNAQICFISHTLCLALRTFKTSVHHQWRHLVLFGHTILSIGCRKVKSKWHIANVCNNFSIVLSTQIRQNNKYKVWKRCQWNRIHRTRPWQWMMQALAM